MAFKFIRTGTGELSGPSMIYQIEQGFDDTAAFVEEVHKTAENAEATANKALEEATEATSVANVALKTAQDAQTSAEAAQNRADEAWNAATGGGESAEAAMQRANAAYELADTANANALSAQSKADAATTAAEEATTAASTATTAATEATATANEAISKAGTAEFAANQASSDVRMLKSIIDGLENAANEFEADSYTTSLDSFVSALVKKYMTGAITSALPDGVSAPFWFYNWSTSDLAKVFQFIQTNTGSYGRIGTPSGITMRDGEDTFYIQFKSGTSTSATSVAISCADNALTAAGQHGFTWTATSTPARGLVGTLAWDATAPDGMEITIGNRVVATVTGGNVVVSDFSPSPSTNATLALTGGTITTSSTTLEISFVWTSLDASGCTWDAWNALLGGTVAGDFVPDSRRVIAGTGLTGGGPLSSDVTLAAKLTNSVNLTDSTTAASATAVKSAYDRGTAGVTAAGEAKTTAENALTVANSKQPNLGFTPVQQGGGSGQDNSKIYIGHGTNGLKAQIGTTDLGYIVTTAAGTTKAANSASADRAQVAGSAETLFVTGWGNTKWGSTPYGQSPLYVWCLPSGGSDMMPCSPGVLSAGAANFCTYTPNVRVGTDGSVLPAGGTWRIMTSRNGEGAIMDLAGGSTVSTAGGVFMAIRVA